MQLLLRRTQKSGLTGKITFSLYSKVRLDEAEAGHVKKYRMGKEVLYEKIKMSGGNGGMGFLGDMASIARSLAAKALNITVTINDLLDGKTVDCKDIIEMRAAEDQIKEACGMFKEILESAAHFEGEEVIDY